MLHHHKHPSQEQSSHASMELDSADHCSIEVWVVVVVVVVVCGGGGGGVWWGW